MHNDQATLEPAADDGAVNRVLLEAIARRLCVTVVYNRQGAVLAPHILYLRHGDPFIDAVTVEREGKPPREIKLGTFKLAGLSGVTLTERPFDPDPSFDAGSERYAGGALFAV